MMDYAMILKLVVLAVAGIIFGYLLGRKTASTGVTPYAGDIIFEKHPDGHERCIFKMEQDEQWLTKQTKVYFNITHTVGNGTEYEEEESS